MKEKVRSLSNTIPELGRPGAGVSGLTTFVMSRIGRPVMSLLPWSKGLAMFEREGEKILSVASRRTPDELTICVLVPPQAALEDSSRFWSAAMVARHLIITGEKIARIMLCLGKGEICDEPVNTAEVKPDPKTRATIFDEFRAFLSDFGRMVREDIVNRHSLMTHPHPWSGQMTVHQWLFLAAMHQHIHRVQLRRILAKLP